MKQKKIDALSSKKRSEVPESHGFKVLRIPILDNNYVWVLQKVGSSQVIVFDPGHAKPIIECLERQKLDVKAIFITHSHHDHIDGLDEILGAYPAPVYGPDCAKIPQVTHIVGDNDTISIEGFGSFSVMHLPGHLPEHVAYALQTKSPNKSTQPALLFSGDILFSSGCGRIFQGTAAELHNSLTRLSKLPDSTLVYASHEYTVQNIEFALSIEPENTDLKSKASLSRQLRDRGQSTLPTQIGIENATNPFLRCSHKSVQKSVRGHTNESLVSETDIFAELRKMKDVF